MARASHEKPVWSVTKKNGATRLVRTDSKGPAKIVRKFKELARRELWTRNDPDHRVDWTDDRVWEKIKNEGCYHRADEMLVSCGTVTLDQADSPCPKVLMVFNKNIGIYQLPKGRKNFDEGYLDTALRETAEETGVATEPLRLRFGSRSTPPKSVQTEARYGVEDKHTGITECLSNESIGVSEWWVDQSSFTTIGSCFVVRIVDSNSANHPCNPDPATGAWRHIYWFAAKPLGDIKRDESRMTDEEDRKKFSTFWFPETEAISMLKLEDEKFMVRVAFAYIRNMSASDWASSRELEEKGGKAQSSGNEGTF
ncbi:hypothetical protein AAE478_008796 [Parahypoxylon ruwenzoriense]